MSCTVSFSPSFTITFDITDKIPAGAANRFPDKCDRDPQKARQINVSASRHLAQTCSKADILLIYISTDYVFPGKPGEAPYEADAEAHPATLYGQTKLEGENAVLESTKDTSLGVILRVPVLYGKTKEPNESAVNVLMETLKKAQDNKDGTVVIMDHWAQRYPTNIEDVARVCLDVASKYLEEERGARQGLPKILQFSSGDKYTKYEMVQLFAEIMGWDMRGIVVDEDGGSGQRPYDSHLSTRTLHDIGIKIHTQDFKAWW